MFPTANSTVYYNEEGEVLGWDTHYYDEGPCIDDYDSYDSWGESPWYDSTDECIEAHDHAQDGDGTGEDDTYACCYCGGLYHVDDDGVVTLR